MSREQSIETEVETSRAISAAIARIPGGEKNNGRRLSLRCKNLGHVGLGGELSDSRAWLSNLSGGEEELQTAGRTKGI